MLFFYNCILKCITNASLFPRELNYFVTIKLFIIYYLFIMMIELETLKAAWFYFL